MLYYIGNKGCYVINCTALKNVAKESQKHCRELISLAESRGTQRLVPRDFLIFKSTC